MSEYEADAREKDLMLGEGLVGEESHDHLDKTAAKPKSRSGKLLSLEEDFAREFGAGKIVRLGSNEKLMDVKVRSSGSLWLDYALGGGYPQGGVVELRGVEKSGKTTLLNLAIAEAQRNEPDKENIVVDLEYTYSVEWAATLGVDVDRLFVVQPDTYAERVYDQLEYILKTGRFAIAGVDSVAGLITKEEWDNDDWDKNNSIGGASRINSKAMRKLVNSGVLSNSGTTLIYTNQLRDKIGAFSAYGTPTDTPGGRALKHNCSQQLDVAVGEQFKKGSGDATVVLGQQIKVKIAKNKLAAPYKRATLDLYYATGLDKIVELVNIAKAVNVLQGTSWLTLIDPSTGEIQKDSDNRDIKYNGTVKTVEALNEDVSDNGGELYFRILALVQEALRS